MELITYRKTLDVHKNGIQFMLQGFETADNMSRVAEINLMASGDAIDFPLERIMALMYVTTPSATEPSINECTIKDNKVVYNVLPIVEEGITTMQLKLIETSPEGAKHVLAAPKFAVEVTKSIAEDESVKQNTTFTALEDAVAKAKTVYDERFLRLALDSDCIFRAYYADGTCYETDLLKKMFHEGNSLLSQSFARGDSGIRDGEETDNAKYYSNVARSESLNAKAIMEGSEEILEEVKLHGVYTAFEMDFETGELVYISPKYKFKLNTETGELDAEGEAFAPEDVLLTIVKDWLEKIDIKFPDDFNNIKLKVDEQGETIKKHATTLGEYKEKIETHSEELEKKASVENFVELWKIHHASVIKNGNGGYAVSPNKAYACVASVTGTQSPYTLSIDLYRTKDGSRVGNLLTLASSYINSHYQILMDDDFIMIDYSNCYKYTDDGVEAVGFASGVAPVGEYVGLGNARYINTGTNGDNLWFWLCTATNAEYTLYRLDKNTMQYYQIKTVSSTASYSNDSMKKYIFTGKCYSDGNDCVTVYYTAKKVTCTTASSSALANMTGINLYLERITSDGEVTTLFYVENIDSSTTFPAIKLLSYDPQTEQVVISGGHTDSSVYNVPLTLVYNSDGTLSHSSSLSIYSDKMGEIVNGYIIGDIECFDLNTLERSNNTTIISDTTEKLGFAQNNNYFPVSIGDNVLISELPSSHLAFGVKKLKLGGWLSDE